MMNLGNSLGGEDDAIAVLEATLANCRRHVASTNYEGFMISVQQNLAAAYARRNEYGKSAALEREMYAMRVARQGMRDEATIELGVNYAASLERLGKYDESKALIRELRRGAAALGSDHFSNLRLRWLYGLNLYKDTDATLDDLIESVAVLTKTSKDWRRVLGDNNPYTSNIRGCLSRAQEKLADARAAASNKSKPPP